MNDPHLNNKSRRHQENDWLLMLIRVLTLLSWSLFIIALIVSHYARPELEYGIVRFLGGEFRSEWLQTPKHILQILLLVCAVLSNINIILRQRRNRRASDSIGLNQIGLFIFSAILLIVIQFS